MADTNSTTATQDPADIERDIRKTQEDMSRTVDRIGDQLSPRNLINSLLDRTESGNIDTRALLDSARRNPVALALIAGGTIWLLSENDAKLPSLPSLSSLKPERKERPADTHHRDYVSHMATVEWRDGEDPASYQRRRDIARANYFMIERGHEEDESAFRQRLDQATESFRSARKSLARRGRRLGQAMGSGAHRMGDAASSTGQGAMDRSRQAYDAAGRTGRDAYAKGQELYTENPLIGGLVAAAVGAVFGSLLPITRTEQQQLGSAGTKVREMADEQKSRLTDVVQEKKDQLVAKVEEKVQSTPSETGTAEPQPSAVSSPTQPAFG